MPQNIDELIKSVTIKSVTLFLEIIMTIEQVIEAARNVVRKKEIRDLQNMQGMIASARSFTPVAMRKLEIKMEAELTRLRPPGYDEEEWRLGQLFRGFWKGK